MKSEDRHKLQQNELADWIGRTYQVIKPYSNAILAVVLLVVVGTVLWSWWNRQSASEASAGWDQIFTALGNGHIAELGEIADQYPNGEIGLWAIVISGDIHLAKGCGQLFTNKASASQELQKAQEEYAKVYKKARNPQLREQAIFGLARTYEALSGTRQSQGEIDKAISSYRELVEKWKDGPYYAWAKERLRDLDTTDAKTFYDKFAHYDPQPKVSPPLTPPAFDSKSLQEQAPPPSGGQDIKFSDIGKNLGKTTEPEKSAKPATPAKPSTLPALPDTTVPKPSAKTPAKEPAKK
jgi:tetratricopeptide (TPR) repeat protein